MSGGAPRTWIAIVGAGDGATHADLTAAEDAGTAVAAAGGAVVCGGLGGVMEAACRGARSLGGLTLGLLPGADRDAANGWVTVAVPTGMGEARNVLVVRAADAVIAIGGGWGTLSEIAVARKLGRPVVGVGTWDPRAPGAAVDGVVAVADGRAAAGMAMELAGSGGGS